MAVSPPAAVPPAVGVPASSPPPPARGDESVRSLLAVSRTIAILFAALAGLLFLVFLAFAFLDLLLGRGAGNVLLAVYCLASAAVNYVLWREIPQLQKLVAAGRWAALRDQVLVWGILGILFFVVVGLLLLVVWTRAELLAGSTPSA
jgi:membrane protease YdiL (CAAX protease family)